MKINELRPFTNQLELTVKVLSKNEIRDVVSKEDNSAHRVTEALVGDDTGTILLTLWDDNIDKLEIGETYRISNVSTTLFQKSMRLNLGRMGAFEKTTALENVNEENNISESPVSVVAVKELKPFVRNVDLVVKVLSKNEVREVVSKEDNATHRVTEALVGDESGVVFLTLWDDSVDAIQVGESYKLGNVFTSLFSRTLRLNLGRNGILEKAKTPVSSVNEANNLSEKQFSFNSDRRSGPRRG